MEKAERGKALGARDCNISIGKHEGQLEQNLWQSSMKDIDLGNLIEISSDTYGKKEEVIQDKAYHTSVKR